jgi:hypothetical protein
MRSYEIAMLQRETRSKATSAITSIPLVLNHDVWTDCAAQHLKTTLVVVVQTWPTQPPTAGMKVIGLMQTAHKLQSC